MFTRPAALLCAGLILLPNLAAAQGTGPALYPKPTSSEDYISPLERVEGRDGAARTALVAALTEQQFSRGYPPQAALLITGVGSEELAIIALHRGALATPFQARAYLSQLAPTLRSLPDVAASGITLEHGTLDLLKLFGFRRVTVSDGESFSMQINLF